MYCIELRLLQVYDTISNQCIFYRTETAGYMVPSLIYVLYRTETAGYMIPSLIYVLYRTETAGYMVPSLIWGIIGILLNAASMIWQVVPQTLKE